MRRWLLAAVLGVALAGCGSASAASSSGPSTSASASARAGASAARTTGPSPSAATPSPSPFAYTPRRPAATATPNVTDTTRWRAVGEAAWHWRLLLPADAVAITATDARSPATVTALETAHPNDQPWIGAVASQLGDGTDVVFRMSARVYGGLVSVSLYRGEYEALGSTPAAIAAWAKAQSATSETPGTVETVTLPAGEAVRVDQGASGTVYYIAAGANVWALSGTVLDGDGATVEAAIDTIARTFRPV